MSEQSPVERALDVVVYAPLGVALFARDALPGIAGMFVARGRSEIEHRRKNVAQQVTQAKTVGRFAVRFGAPEVKRRVEGGVASAKATAETTLGSLAAVRGTGSGSTPTTEPPAAPKPRAEAACGRERPRTEQSERIEARTHLPGCRRSRTGTAGVGPSDPRLRRAVGQSGRRSARGPQHDRPRDHPVLRECASEPADDPREDRAAPPVMEHARAARADDIGEIAQLAHLLLEELEPTRGGALWARRERRDGPYEDTYGALLARDDAFVVVGTVHDVVVGFGVVLLETLRDGGVLGVVTDLFVDPGARSVGVGEAMVERIIGFCTDHHCVGIDALVLPGHRAAKNFFEESGFTARALVMHHKPTP